MTSNPQMITGVLRKWRRQGNSVRGYVYESDIWDYGEPCYLEDGHFVEASNFYLYVTGRQVYKLPKDEEIIDEDNSS